MSGLNPMLAQQVQDLLEKTKQQNAFLAAWLGGSPTGGPNSDGRYPFKDLAGGEILVPSPATFNDMVSGPAALAVAARVASDVARDLAQGHADRANDQRILSEAARGAAVEARNLAQQHMSHAGTSEANARYWAELARTQGEGSSADRIVVEQLAAETADNAALAAQDADDAATSAAQAATFNPALYDLKSDSLAAERLTGTLDPARLPSNVFQAPIVALSNIASLTAAQQNEVRKGSTVVTSDGVFWSFVEGSKTVEASYRAMADTTPPWSAIADKPTTFPATAHMHNITDTHGLFDALNAKAPLANATFTTAISVAGSVGAYSFAANHSLFYPDGNHTVIKTGPGGSERYWRFDQDGTLYSLNGGLYAAGGVHAFGGNITVGAKTGANRADLEKGWLELRSQNGPYLDLSKDAAADFHARIQYQTDNYFVLTANGARLIHRPDGRLNAESSDGVQSGEILTLNGAEQLISTKQLTFASRQNPQDGGAYAPLEVRGEGGGYGAWMKFHRPGAYGTYFGMFEDGRWGFGGWSTGATIHEFWTSKNFDPGTRMERYNDGWIHTRDNNERFYFATNGRTYMRSRGGFEWRDNGDIWQAILSNDGVFETKNTISTLGNNIKIRGGSPTIYFKDTDNRSAMIHVNSNRFYVLRGSGNDQEGWSTIPNKGWPMEIDLETNHATFGGSIYLNSEWLRIHGQTGVYWETYGGGWHMSDTGWIRAYGSKGIYTAGQVRGGTVVGESDRRLKTNIATITDATQKVEALTGVTFDWKRTGSAGMGFIAQDFEQVIPALVTEDTDGMKGVEYGPVVALLVEAMKETNARVALLESGRV